MTEQERRNQYRSEFVDERGSGQGACALIRSLAETLTRCVDLVEADRSCTRSGDASRGEGPRTADWPQPAVSQPKLPKPTLQAFPVSINLRGSRKLKDICVAKFSDPTGLQSPDSYQVVVAWNDGSQPGPAQVLRAGETFAVIASHEFASVGRHRATVTVSSKTSTVTVVCSALVGTNQQRFIALAYSDIAGQAISAEALERLDEEMSSGRPPELVISDLRKTWKHGAHPTPADFRKFITWWEALVYRPPILETDYTNPSYPTSDVTWAKNITGGATFLSGDHPDYEWIPILAYISTEDRIWSPWEFLNGWLVGLSGTAIKPELSEADIPFTHPFGNDPFSGKVNGFGPFGNDFTFGVAPDADYYPLMAPSDMDLTSGIASIAPWLDPESVPNWLKVDDDARDALAVANDPDGLNLGVPGVLHVEMDQGLIDPYYRPLHGDRVAVFGRWIIDVGHDSFGAEIHPPLAVATARADDIEEFGQRISRDDATHSTLTSRPYLVDEVFSHDNGTPRGLAAHVADQLSNIYWHVWENDVHINPNILEGWKGFSVLFSYTVRTPTQRKAPGDRLFVRFRFTVRTGINISVLNRTDDGVLVQVAIDGSTFHAAPVPPPGGVETRVHISDLPPDVRDKVNAALDAKINQPGTVPLGRDRVHAAIDKGAIMTWYPVQRPVSPADQQPYVTIAVDQLPIVGSAPNGGIGGIAEDDDQPFPMYGFLDVFWQRA